MLMEHLQTSTHEISESKYLLDCFKQTKMNMKHNILIACIAEFCLNKQTNQLHFVAQSGFSHLECGFLDDDYHLAIL